MKRPRFLLLFDTILLLVLLILLTPGTSLAVHEWLGLAAIILIAVHLLWAWPWIATTPRRIAANGTWRLRVNVLLNILLFYAFVAVTFTGVMTSFIALPALGIAPGNFRGWGSLHHDWAVNFRLLAPLHLAMNWNWIVGTIRGHVLARLARRGNAVICEPDS